MTISGAPREPAAPIAHALTRRGRAEPRTGRGRENRLRSGRYCSRMAASSRAFILRHTRLRPVPGLEEIRLHLADDALPLWHAVQIETGDPDTALPYLSLIHI